MKSLETLAADWIEAKRLERQANSQRLAIEEEMLEQIKPNKEGRTTTHLDTGFKIISTAKMTFKADIDAMYDLTNKWDQAMVPLKTKIELDDTKLKLLRDEYPKLWLEIAPVIDSKPAKTHIAVEV
jgi:SMC interacting uncharacterized protein involved in chromosome segregation